MKIYLSKTIASMDAFINGMTANVADWAGQPIQPLDMTGSRNILKTAAVQIDTVSATLKEANHAASIDNSASKKLLTQAENLAYGLYADNPVKLAEYGLKPRKDPSKVPPPTSTLAITITDDTDGEGFVLTIAAKDAVADSYEWKKGQGLDPKDTKTTPAMLFFKNSTKLTFVDDDVIPGVRYFYSVRAVNRNGKGPESDVASRVQ
jgi:hypothetical protein